jgi:TM2 domain-containing membrane protein YozV
VALIASFFIPGLGSLINGNAGMGIAIFAAYCVAWVLCLVFIGFVLLPAVWVWGMIDAYQGAKNWNTAHGIIS